MSSADLSVEQHEIMAFFKNKPSFDEFLKHFSSHLQGFAIEEFQKSSSNRTFKLVFHLNNQTLKHLNDPLLILYQSAPDDLKQFLTDEVVNTFINKTNFVPQIEEVLETKIIPGSIKVKLIQDKYKDDVVVPRFFMKVEIMNCPRMFHNNTSLGHYSLDNGFIQLIFNMLQSRTEAWSKIDSTNSTNQSVSDRLDAMETRQGAVEKRQDDLEERQDDLEHTMGAMMAMAASPPLPPWAPMSVGGLTALNVLLGQLIMPFNFIVTTTVALKNTTTVALNTPISF